MKPYQVRFHLGRGLNYMHWQIKVLLGRKEKDVFYYDPAYYQLELIDCTLVNRVNVAKRVHTVGVKDVSGWIECERVMVNNEIPVDNLERLYYNPIRDVHWRRESDKGEFVWDGSQYETLITQNNQVYILEERK